MPLPDGFRAAPVHCRRVRACLSPSFVFVGAPYKPSDDDFHALEGHYPGIDELGFVTQVPLNTIESEILKFLPTLVERWD